MAFLKIYYDNRQPTLVDIPTEPHAFLEACYREIECDCIEVASTRFDGIVLILDESGKLKEGWRDRVNLKATMLYAGGDTDAIVGDVLVGRVINEDIVGLTDGLTEKEARALFRAFRSPGLRMPVEDFMPGDFPQT